MRSNEEYQECEAQGYADKVAALLGRAVLTDSDGVPVGLSLAEVELVQAVMA